MKFFENLNQKMIDLYTFTYVTDCTINECIEKLMQPPCIYKFDWIYAREYAIQRESDVEIMITFTVGYNLQSHETTYRAYFDDTGVRTRIVLKYVSESCGSCVPYVADYEISKLFKERIDAEPV